MHQNCGASDIPPLSHQDTAAAALPGGIQAAWKPLQTALGCIQFWLILAWCCTYRRWCIQSIPQLLIFPPQVIGLSTFLLDLPTQRLLVVILKLWTTVGSTSAISSLQTLCWTDWKTRGLLSIKHVHFIRYQNTLCTNQPNSQLSHKPT